MADEITWQSLAEKPGGDHDLVYFWGNPRGGLTTMQQCHLTIMRGIMRDVSHAPDSIRNELRYGGDNDQLVQLQNGLYVATDFEPLEAS